MVRSSEATYQYGENIGTIDAREIPEEEIQQLALCVGDAQEWASRGRPSLGYAILLRGFLRAERALLAGHSWAPELVRCWRAVIDRFCEHHDPSPGE